MNRKTTALAVAGLTLVTLVCVAVLVPMPYVVMSPGVTEDTLGSFKGKAVISVTGHKTYPTSGRLDLTTVSVTSPDYEPKLPDVITAWWSADKILLPREVVYPPDQSVAQVNEENETQMLGSQSSAVAAGLAAAGIDAVRVRVEEVAPGSPAEGLLRKADEIVSVNGGVIDSTQSAVEVLTTLPPGSEAAIGIRRGGARLTVDVVTEASPDDDSKSRVGVVLSDDFDPPFDVNIDLGQDIGGPSAGLMFSLAIYDKITPGALTGGEFVAGTGTIDPSGKVGEIGGIQQKIAGARLSGATVFLVPSGNCEEAGGSRYADDVDLIDVSTMDTAVSALEALAAGTGSDVERCGG